jgi:hypothetical protein
MTTTPRTDDPAQIPWAQTETRPTQTVPYAAPSNGPVPAAGVGSTPTTAPALNPPTWTGRKTAIAAALAIGISSMGAVAAAAALPAGTSQGGGQTQQGGFGRGGGQLPGGGTGQQGGFGTQGGTTQQGQGGPGTVQQAPDGTSQLPRQLQQAPADPNASTT